MTQVYSNLVNYVNSTAYLCLVLAVLWFLVIIGLGLPHCTLDYINGSISLHHLMCSLASVPFLLFTENKGGPTHGFKTKNLLYSMEV